MTDDEAYGLFVIAVCLNAFLVGMMLPHVIDHLEKILRARAERKARAEWTA